MRASLGRMSSRRYSHDISPQWVQKALFFVSGAWERREEKDAVVSVHPEPAGRDPGRMGRDARAAEFDRLVEASNCAICHSVCLPLRRIFAGALFGRGQIEDIRRQVEAHQAVVVFVDHPLTPVQQRNLERAWDAKVVDRTGLILEIFAARARTREGALQVELASLNYQISRLVRSWTHLERQRGGFGFLGGPGERQIELDRRMIRNRIRQLEKELAKVRRMRAIQRAGRRRTGIPTVALVGYTNAGKSTLFNRLTRSSVHAADQLFATLDPVLRRLNLEDGLALMLSDTVGFVQELPPELVDAFRATLEEVRLADLILHVRDAADPQVIEQGRVVEKTLRRIGIEGADAPVVIEVWNKIDLKPEVRSRILPEIADSRVALSALSGRGVDELLALLHRWLESRMVEMRLVVSAADGKTLAWCHERGHVIRQREKNGVIHLTVRLPSAAAARLARSEGLDRITA